MRVSVGQIFAVVVAFSGLYTTGMAATEAEVQAILAKTSVTEVDKSTVAAAGYALTAAECQNTLLETVAACATRLVTWGVDSTNAKALQMKLILQNPSASAEDQAKVSAAGYAMTVAGCQTTTMESKAACLSRVYNWGLDKTGTNTTSNTTSTGSGSGGSSGSNALNNMMPYLMAGMNAGMNGANGGGYGGGGYDGGNGGGGDDGSSSAAGSYNGPVGNDQGFLKQCKDEKACAALNAKKAKEKADDKRTAHEKNEDAQQDAINGKNKSDSTNGLNCKPTCYDAQDGKCRQQVQFKSNAINSIADAQKYTNRQIGSSTECAALVQALSGVGLTSTWRKGASVAGDYELPVGTAIATFNYRNGTAYGNNADGGGGTSGMSHTAIYLGRDCKGIWVLHQWNRKGGGVVSQIPWGSWSGSVNEAGTKYYAISH